MSYRTVEESSLTGIADAIREAGGTGESLLFPDDFLTAISNMGGTGGVLTVLAPAGHTVTISKDGKTKTKTANDDGVAVFKGLSAGAWTYVITDGTQTSQPKTADVAYETTVTASYSLAIINITYPAGSTCTATDGTTTLTAPDTSGIWECHVQNTGTWTVTLDSGFAETVKVTANGETHTIDKWYLYKRGVICNTNVSGGLGLFNYTYGKNNIAATYKVDHIVLNGDAGSCFAGTKNAIDLSKFKTLTGVGQGSVGGIFVSKTPSSFSARTNFPSSEGENSIDLTGYSDQYYLGFQCTSSGTAYAYELYLQ